jgi:hypothetical protein
VPGSNKRWSTEKTRVYQELGVHCRLEPQGDKRMGYIVHITRAEKWHESENAPIRAEEWLATVEADPEMRLLEGTWAEWLGHPDRIVSFGLRDGAISFKHPDDYTLSKMIDLAERLEASVIGDDGEEYGHQTARELLARAGTPRPQDVPLPVKEAHSYGVYFPALELEGIRPRRVTIAVHTDRTGQSHLAIRRRRGTVLLELDEESSVKPCKLLPGLTIGFRLMTPEVKRCTILVSRPRNWIRYLENPKTPVAFASRWSGWEWIWPTDEQRGNPSR